MAVGELSFGFGGDTGAKTPEELAKRRAIAEALAGRIFGTAPKNVGEGLSAIGQALALRSMNARNAKAETAGRESASSAFEPIIAALGGGQFPAAPAAPGGGSDYASQRVSQAHGDGDAISAGLVERGLPQHVADAFVMNFQDESGLNPGINEANPTVPGSRGGFGLYQLTGPRRDAYEAFAAQRGVDPADTDAQLDFMMTELQGPEANAFKSIMAAPDTGSAAAAIVNNFLRPAEAHRSSREARYLRTGGQPAQVASLDQSIGMPPEQGGSAAGMGGGVPMGPTAPNPNMAGNAQPPGTHTMPDGSVMADAEMSPMVGNQPVSGPGAQLLTIPQPITGPNSPAMPMMPGAQAAPVQQPQPAPVQTAQAQPMPEMAGNVPDMRGSSGVSLPQLLQAAQNPWLSEGQRSIIQALIGQEMQKNDPMRQMEMERAQLELEALRNPQGDQFSLSPGEIRFDAQGNQIATGGEKPRDLPSGVQEYEYAKSQGFPGTFQDWEASKKGGMSLQVDPATGAITFQQGGNIKPLTEGQSKDTVFATRAQGALPLIDQFGDALTSLPETMGGQVPGVGNYLKSREFQQAEQAGKEFLQAILRKDTGAAITNEETTEYGSVYLPRPGDTPELLAQKKVSRQRALEAIKAGMPAQAILAQEKALSNIEQPKTPEKPLSEMTDEELEAIINGR